MEKNQNEKNHPFPWLNFVVTEPFYLFHFFTFFSYFVFRSFAIQIMPPDSASRLLHREIQAILAFSVLIAIKLVKEETWEAFIADTLFLAKGFLIVVAFVMDYHLALCYMVVLLVIFILTQQPAYHGLGNSSQLTPLQLETLLTEGKTSRFWLVEFQALCSSKCIRASSLFADLSTIYGNENISFGIVDLGHFPNAAEKFGISLGVSAGELPTYILFDNAVEVARFPEVDFGAKSSTPTMSKGLLCRHFELDLRLIEYISGK